MATLAKRFEGMKVEAAAFTDELSRGAGKAVAAMAELRDSMREVEAEQRRMAKPPKVPASVPARPDRAIADDAAKVTKKAANVGSVNGSRATTNAARGRPQGHARCSPRGRPRLEPPPAIRVGRAAGHRADRGNVEPRSASPNGRDGPQRRRRSSTPA